MVYVLYLINAKVILNEKSQVIRQRFEGYHWKLGIAIFTWRNICIYAYSQNNCTTVKIPLGFNCLVPFPESCDLITSSTIKFSIFLLFFVVYCVYTYYISLTPALRRWFETQCMSRNR